MSEYNAVRYPGDIFDRVLCGAHVFRRLIRSDDHPVCSWVAVHCYGKLGLHFGVETGAAAPDDIHDVIVEKHLPACGNPYLTFLPCTK